jgi:hypothetical protein
MLLDRIPKPARRFLLVRLQRLQEALEALGQRLREGIAQLVGRHVGDAVRDAIERVLCQESSSHLPERPLPPYRGYRGHHNAFSHPYEDYPEEEGFWGDREPMAEEPEPQTQPSRRRALLAGLAQLTGWWLKHRPRRPALRWVLAAGAAVGIATVVAGSPGRRCPDGPRHNGAPDRAGRRHQRGRGSSGNRRGPVTVPSDLAPTRPLPLPVSPVNSRASRWGGRSEGKASDRSRSGQERSRTCTPGSSGHCERAHTATSQYTQR